MKYVLENLNSDNVTSSNRSNMNTQMHETNSECNNSTCHLLSQNPSLCPHQPAPESAGQEVPSDQVPQVHLHHLHPRLSRQEPAHHLCLFRGRDEGPVHRPAGLRRHEPQS